MRYLLTFFSVILILSVAGCGKKNNLPTAADCSKFMDKKLRSDCIYNMSIGNHNPAFCKDIPDLNIRSKCITDIAITLDQESYCIEQDRLPVKEDCERKVAEARKAKKANLTA